MASAILDEARKEAETLRARLSENPVYQKLQQVQKLIDLYERLEPADGPLPTTSKPVSSSSPRAGSKTARINDVVANYLSQYGRRASSSELLSVVEDADIQLSGRIPSKTLSAFLAKSTRFNNLKGYGYGLVEWGVGLGPNGEVLLRQLDELASRVLEGDDLLSSPSNDHQPRAVESAKHGG